MTTAGNGARHAMDQLQQTFGLPTDQHTRLAELLGTHPSQEPARVPLPPRGDAAAALAPFALQDRDTAELLQLWPDDTWPPQLRRLLAQLYARVRDDLGASTWRAWPSLIDATDARVRCVIIYAFAAAVPELRAWHARHGVPPEVTAATLADVGRHVAKTRDMFGRLGLEVATWIALHFRGGLYELGRLQYEPAKLGAHAAITWYGPERQHHLPADLRTGQPVLRLHIPETGPLHPTDVTHSLEQARAFFMRHFGQDYPVASCSSWLLDPQLGEYLSAEANILEFQRRFTLVEDSTDGDADVFRFVFRHPRVAPDAVPQRSRLERSMVAHLHAGRNWRVRTGWLRL